MIQGPIELLTEDADVVAAVGNNALGSKSKISWAVCPDTESAPYMILSVQSNAPVQVKGETSSLDRVQFAVFSYSSSPEKVDVMDRAGRAALEQVGVTAGGYFFHRIFFVTQNDGYDRDAKLPYRVSIYEAQVQRTQPT
jgi:hypothetical protein